ncbi:hypothetical protein BBJ29_009527 [Phytophthora kernoviae]|uniref:Multiple inositol polyphosphate phosphatase 1 n=1 Tax=Phytophthora kernoviae TaxID=325452 RepID=A0A3F2RC41_9STRA|nr:hypothetical protein BBP00_00009614 [Phytophthora kernoviae]RLN60358.1 hypothetical protein BBJ29_009527 [Phytophthora kernoviae]
MNAAPAIAQFGLVIAGRPVITDFREIGPAHYVVDIVEPMQVTDLTFFLLPGSPVPPGFGAVLYFAVPALQNWQLLGTVFAEKPSAIFRTSWPTHPDVVGQPVLQLGVSIESLDNVKNLGIEASGLEEREAFALKIAQDLFNYLSSFSTSTNQNYMTIPTNLLDREVLRKHMSTKTIYEPPTEDIQTIPESCVPVQLNFAIRHGTRNPTVKDITRIGNTHSRLLAAQSGGVESTGSTWIKNWTNPFPIETEAWLAEPGVRELIAMGKRLHARLSSLPVHFNTNKFVFEHTWKLRTLQSAEAFAFGFFDGLQPVFYHTDPIGGDQVLRFFDNCPVFATQIEQNKSATIEHRKYRGSKQMKKNLATFRRISGFEGATQKDLEAAYAGCAFDVAVQGVFDKWCTLFDDEMLLSMDYFQDLKHFYKKSHGHLLSHEIAAPLLQDIFRTMKQRVEGKSDIEGYFRFAHAETILPLAALLNVSYFDRHTSDKEGHFRADTPLELALQRKFKSSALSPFAANIGFVLYECTSDERKPHAVSSNFKVKTLLNEREVEFFECTGQTLCPFEVLENIFHRWVYEFNFEEHCAIP